MKRKKTGIFIDNIRPVVLSSIVYIVSSLFFSASLFALPWSYKITFDAVLPSFDYSFFGKLAVFILAGCAISVFFNVVSQMMKQTIGQAFAKSLRLNLLGKIIDYEYPFFLRNTPGQIINQLIPEIDGLGVFVVSFFQAVSGALQIAAFFVVISLIDGQVFLIYGIVAVCSIIWIVLLKKKIAGSSEKLIAARGRTYDFFYELIPAVKEVKCRSLYGVFQRKLDDIMEAEKQTQRPVHFYSAWLRLGSIAPVMLGNLCIIYLSYYRFTNGGISIGMILTILSFLYIIISPMNELINALITIQNKLASVKNMKSFYSSTAENCAPGDIAAVRQGIGIRDLDFSYQDGKKILTRLKLEFKTNDAIVIIGKSGSGKSTILNLLLKLFGVDDGKIFVDARDLNTVTHGNMRNLASVVTQDTFILNDTLRNNIDVNGTLTDGEILELCRECALDDLVRQLPGGIDYRLSERGMNLSGGERQRIMIARCLAKKSKFVFLDEATSSLDVDTEKKILGNIFARRKRSDHFTIVMITHRPAPAKDADLIVVLEDGRIVERGVHRELMARKGAYYDLFKEE